MRQQPTPSTDLWPIWKGTDGPAIGYIVATDDIPGLSYPRIGEVYRTPRGWAAWAMGAVFGDDIGPRSVLGFRTRRAAITHLVTCAQERVRTRPDPRPVAAALDDFLEQLEITRALVAAL